MRKHFLMLAALIILLPAVGSQASSSDSFSQTIEIYRNSPQVQPFFESAYGYAVFPTVGKGGLLIGGAYGEGRVYLQGKATGRSTVFEVSFGLQAGGQAYSQMIFFQDKRAYDEFTSGEFGFDATASAVAITAGAQSQAGTSGVTAGVSAGPATGEQAPRGYTKGMAVFFHAKGGLMLEASIGGQKFSFQPLK